MLWGRVQRLIILSVTLAITWDTWNPSTCLTGHHAPSCHSQPVNDLLGYCKGKQAVQQRIQQGRRASSNIQRNLIHKLSLNAKTCRTRSRVVDLTVREGRKTQTAHHKPYNNNGFQNAPTHFLSLALSLVNEWMTEDSKLASGWTRGCPHPQHFNKQT